MEVNEKAEVCQLKDDSGSNRSTLQLQQPSANLGGEKGSNGAINNSKTELETSTPPKQPSWLDKNASWIGTNLRSPKSWKVSLSTSLTSLSVLTMS